MSDPRTFDAWSTPTGTSLPEAPPDTYSAARTVVRHLRCDAAWIRGLAKTLKAARGSLEASSANAIAEVLGRVGERFLDPGDPLRRWALELLPSTSGLSSEMSAAVLDGMAADWTTERLQGLLRAELGTASALDAFVPADRGRIRAFGPALCLQVVSGSVPGVGVAALLRSLLVKAPTLLKPGAGDVVLPVLFARGLREVDPVLADALAVVYWPGGHRGIERAALLEADVAVAYGGDEVVRALRALAPATTRFVAYHHRISLGVVAKEALGPDLLLRTASEVAGAVAFFDQRGCVSPHVVYVETEGPGGAKGFTVALADALATVERHLPGGSLDGTEAAALHQVRGSAELLAASGSGVEVLHGGDASWTVVLDPRPAFAPSCVGRVVRVKAVSDVMRVPALVEPFGPHLQTVGVAGAGDRLEALARALGRVGASRITGFAHVPFPRPWWHHDGRGPLRVLLRWVDLEA